MAGNLAFGNYGSPESFKGFERQNGTPGAFTGLPSGAPRRTVTSPRTSPLFWQKAAPNGGPMPKQTIQPGIGLLDQYAAASDRTIRETIQWNELMGAEHDGLRAAFNQTVDGIDPAMMGALDPGLAGLEGLDDQIQGQIGGLDKVRNDLLKQMGDPSKNIDRIMGEAKRNTRRSFDNAAQTMDAAISQYADAGDAAGVGFMSSFVNGVANRARTARQAISRGVDPESGRMLTPEEQRDQGAILEARVMGEIAPVFMQTFKGIQDNLLSAKGALSAIHERRGGAEIQLGQLGLQGEALKGDLVKTRQGIEEFYNANAGNLRALQSSIRQFSANIMLSAKSNALMMEMQGRKDAADYLLSRPNSLINYSAAIKDMIALSTAPGLARMAGFRFDGSNS